MGDAHAEKAKESDGITLVETIVALAILIAVAIGPLSLVTRSLFVSTFSRNKLVAINLAEEGIELVRAVRENNVLCGLPWDDNPNGGGKIDGVNYPDVIAKKNITSTNCVVAVETPSMPGGGGGAIYLDPSGVYSHTGTAPQQTIFTRTVRVCNPPNGGGSCGEGHDADISPNAQMDVISTVSWTEKGIPRSVVLRERLYDWK